MFHQENKFAKYLRNFINLLYWSRVQLIMGRSALYKKMKGRKYGRPLNKRQKTTVKRLISNTQEKKHYLLTDATGINQSTVATLTKLSTIAQGDTDTTRDGDRLTLKSLRFSATISNSDTYNRFRVILFRWNPDDSTAPVVGDILQNTAGNLLDVLLPTHLDKASNFHVIHDRTYTTAGNAENAAIGINKTFYGKRLGSKTIQYNAGGTTGFRNVWMLTVSDSGAAAHPYIYYTSLLKFTDS